MTERFESIFNGIGLKDNETKNEYLYYCEDAINLMNNLHEENQRLKQWNKCLAEKRHEELKQ